MSDRARWFVAIVATLLAALLVLAQCGRAAACQERGGVYVRAWTWNGYTCLKTERR